mmetsp:Transcript_6131/g.12636  ORF Transcript_6131/g.12636 Transcript_6131/m.12636 type:complete len:1844 (-) Transcript_6131:84-5615(-)
MSTTSKSAVKQSEDDYSPLDLHLAKGEFLERLILVRTIPLSADAPTASTSGDDASTNIVAKNQLWPAIKFNSYHQLNESIKDDLDIPKVKTLRIKIFLQHNKLKADAGKDPAVAYLLGKPRAGTSLVLLPKGADDKNVFDFFDHVADMDTDREYCGSSDFRRAYDLAVKRIEEEYEDWNSSASNETSEELGTEAPEPRCPKHTPTKKSVFEVEDAPDINTLYLSPRLKRYAKVARNETKEEEIQEEENERAKERDFSPLKTAPMKKVEVADKNDELSSLESPSPCWSSGQGTTRTVSAENFTPSPSVMEWRDMWNHLKEKGWRHSTGGGLVSYYYINASCKGMKKRDILKYKTEGLDYFSSEEEVQQFAREHLGWEEPDRQQVATQEIEQTYQDDRSENTEVKMDAEGEEKGHEGEEVCRATNSADYESTPSNEARCENNEEKRKKTPRRLLRTSPAKSPVMNWVDMWSQMRRDGWTYVKGTELVAWYYIKPEFSTLGKTQLFKTTTEGEGYFTSEKDVQKYARQFLGWKGETESSPQYPDVTERVKMRRRRNNTKAASIIDSTKPSSENEVKSKKPTGGRQKTGKTPNTEASTGANQSETSSELLSYDSPSNSSRFSDRDSVSQSNWNVHTKVSQPRSHGEVLAYAGTRDTSETINKKLQRRREKKNSNNDAAPPPTTSEISPYDSTKNSSPNCSQQSSLDESFKLMKDAEAWELLMTSFGFLYDPPNNAYCLPGIENMPSTNPSAEEGVNYFKTLKDLRHNLCAYGMPECNVGATWHTFESWEQIDNWLKYTHVEGLPDGAVVDQSELGEPITIREAWSLLKKLGMKYSSGGYVIPQSHPSEKTWKFERQEDFLEHLSRFGIPSSGGFTNEMITAEERMKLDFYIADTRIDRSVRSKISNSVMVELSPRRRRTRNGNVSYLKPGKGTAKGNQVSQLAAVRLRENKHRTRDLHSEQPAILRNFGGKRVITYDEALRILDSYFNINAREVDGAVYYCLPNIDPKQNSTLNVDYFSSVRDLRSNLCALGVPSLKDAEITETTKTSLEVWIRCSIIGEFCGESFTVRDHFVMETNEAWKILQKLGYKLSKNHGTYYLPGVAKHTSTTGKDCFENIFSLFDHISRFGLITSHEDYESNNEVSTADILRLGVFIMHVGTFDIWDRRDKLAVSRETVFSKKLPATSAASVNIAERRNIPGAGAVMKFPATSTAVAKMAKCTSQPDTEKPKQGAPSVIYDDSEQELSPSPKKKQKVSATLDKYFHQEKCNNRLESSGNDSIDCRSNHSSCISGSLSPSCLDETGDAEVEACIIDSKPSSSPTRIAAAQPFGKHSSVLETSNPNDEEYADSGAVDSTISEAIGMQTKRQLLSEVQNEDSPVKKPRSSTYVETPNFARIRKSEDETNDDIPQCSGDKEITMRGKLEASLFTLHQSYKGEKRLAMSSSDSQLSKMEEFINDFMRRSILTGTAIDGMQCRGPGFMYICGPPGTGKTTTVEACAKNMTKWAKKNGRDKPLFCFINMAAGHSSLGSKGNLMRTTLSKIAKALDMEEGSKLNNVEKALRKKALVLVVDEVDMLFTSHGGVGETWFKSLISICEDDDVHLSMIGISNSINDASAARIRNLANSPEELVFQTYTEQDLMAILQQRVGKKIIDSKALELISRKIATNSGDARRVLELTYNAVNICLEASSEEELSQQLPDDHAPLVKVSHMMKAVRQAMPGRHEDVIRGLPQAAKVVLCIAVTISQAWGPKAEISVATLKKYCVEASMHAIMDELGISQVMNLVETLSDAGLLIIGNRGFFDPSESDMKLKLGVQLDDVETALERSLLTEPFFRRLADYVKKNCHAPTN